MCQRRMSKEVLRVKCSFALNAGKPALAILLTIVFDPISACLDSKYLATFSCSQITLLPWFTLPKQIKEHDIHITLSFHTFQDLTLAMVYIYVLL